MFDKSSHRSLHCQFNGEPLLFEGPESAFPPNCACFCFERQWLVFIFLLLKMSTTLPSINSFPRDHGPNLQKCSLKEATPCSSSSLLTFSKLLPVPVNLWRLQKYAPGGNSNTHSCNDIFKIYSVHFYSNIWTVFWWPRSSWSHRITNYNS